MRNTTDTDHTLHLLGGAATVDCIYNSFKKRRVVRKMKALYEFNKKQKLKKYSILLSCAIF